MSTPAGRRFLAGAVFVVVLLGVGFASYFLGGDQTGTEKPASSEEATVRLSDSVGRGGYEVIDTLELPWGAGPLGVATVPKEGRTTLDSVFLGSNGRIYVVDHIPGRVGARIRWFERGSLVGSHFAPAGSTLFTADGDGFMYAIAKVAGPSEQVVEVDNKGSVTATYTVPMQANSGGLVRTKDTLYARVFYSTTDTDQKVYNATDVLVPVAIDGKQADDATAEEGIVQAWAVLEDGVKVTSRYEGAAEEGEKAIDVSHFVRYGDGDEIKSASSALLIGASSSDEAMWLLYPPATIDARGTAGWPAAYDVQGLLVRITPSGKVLSQIPILMSRIANQADSGWTGRVATDGDRVVAATADAEHVKILVFGRR